MNDFFLHPERDRERIIIGFGRPKLQAITNFLIANSDGEVFTNVLLPEEIVPGYLIGDRGNAILYKTPTIKFLLRHQKGANIGKYTMRIDGAEPLAKTRSDKPLYLRLYKPQLLILVNFCQLHENIIANLADYRCLHLTGDPADCNLKKLYLVKNAGFHKKFTLTEVFKIRRTWRTITPQEWARSLEVDDMTIRKILKNETWRVAEGDLAPIPYRLPKQ